MLTFSSFTNRGSREINEDRIGCFANKGAHCFVVCDGLGGHGMGDAAAQTVVSVFQDLFSKSGDPARFLPEAFTAAQQILLTEQAALNARQKMKTTAVALVTDEHKAYIGHVGDSRLYVFQNNRVLTRTLDHSIPQMPVLSRQLREEEIRNHPDRNIVLRVMGVDWESPMYELAKPLRLRKCQAFLLCTDGFWELILEEEMCEFLQNSSSPEEWLRRMAAQVRERGKGKQMDNYSAIAVWNTR